MRVITGSARGRRLKEQDVEQSLLHSIRCRARLHSLQLF